MRFRGVTAITPNESEAAQATHVRLAGDKDVERAAKILRSKLELNAVLITRGNRGMTLLDNSSKVSHIPKVGKDDVTDVTGAGDTVATVFALSLASGASFYDAARLANYAASIVVMKSGTAVATRAELLETVRKNHG
jgi:rfaE bifunctional protein kinase chain/domain